jgi:hypothetical protein
VQYVSAETFAVLLLMSRLREASARSYAVILHGLLDRKSWARMQQLTSSC